jgi:hypothetical protein
MLTTTVLFLSLLQDHGTPSHQEEPSTVNCPFCLEDTAAAAEARRREARYDEQELLRRVNGLATALTDFSNTYNSRHVIDVKKIKALRKALRELEKSDWLSRKIE